MTYLMILQTNHAKLESKRQWVHRIIHHCCVIPCGVCVCVCVTSNVCYTYVHGEVNVKILHSW